MIVNIRRKEMLALAKKVAKAAPSLTSIEELKGVLVEADERAGTVRMTATNFEVAIQAVMPAAVETGGSAVIDTGLLLGILSLLPEDDVYMETRPRDQLYIQGGGAHYQIIVRPGSLYPKVDIPLPGDTVFVTGLKSLIAGAGFAVSKMKSENPALNCINLTFSKDGLRASAGSAFSVVQVMGDKESVGQISILVPASSLKLLSQLSLDSDVYEVGITGTGPAGKNVVFFDGTLTFSARLIEGKHLDMEQIFSYFIPVTTVEADADALKEAVGNASIFAGGVDAMEISFLDNGLLLKCETDNGSTSNPVSAVIQNPPDKAFYLNVHRLAECVRTLSGKATMIFSAEGNLVIQTDKMRYMQPAVRPRRKKEESLSEKKAA